MCRANCIFTKCLKMVNNLSPYTPFCRFLPLLRVRDQSLDVTLLHPTRFFLVPGFHAAYPKWVELWTCRDSSLTVLEQEEKFFLRKLTIFVALGAALHAGLPAPFQKVLDDNSQVIVLLNLFKGLPITW